MWSCREKSYNIHLFKTTPNPLFLSKALYRYQHSTMHFTVKTVIFTAVYASVASSFKLSFYNGKQCRSAGLGSISVSVQDGCRTDHVGVGSSMVVTSEGEADDGSYLVLFSSDDCNPATIVAHKDSGCADPGTSNYGSFEVWNVMQGKLMCPRFIPPR